MTRPKIEEQNAAKIALGEQIMNAADLPLWVQPSDLEGWPVENCTSPALHYSIPIRQGWQTRPTVNQTPMEIEHIFRGSNALEQLTVSFMSQANPEHPLRNWLEGMLLLTGFPLLSMQPDGQPPPQLLDWQYQGNCPPYAERLAVDEVHLYQGLAQLPDSSSELARLYILLARRGNFAWKIGLSLLSAGSPEMPENFAAASIAGATFGSLRLL